MNKEKSALQKHAEWKGKFSIAPICPLETAQDLTIAYTPGVAEPCKEISKDPRLSYKYTRRWNLVAVVTDGSAVLGLGDIGPEASMPVMEGKSVLFKNFADVDAIPLCIKSKEVDEIVRTVYLLSGGFGGINLEDISAPRCFEIERRLKEICDIPVFHDDQHGTAIVVAAGLLNALICVGKKIENIKIVISGAGAAGIAIAKLLLSFGATNIILGDINGAIYHGREDLDTYRQEFAKLTNLENIRGSISDIIKGSDVFIGVSAPGIVSGNMIKSMAKKPIVFAMANPDPEISYNDAVNAGAKIVGTGRSDFPNQINNLLAFPGVFRGALDAGAKEINEEMKIAAARAIAALVTKNQLSQNIVIPSALDKRVAHAVAGAVQAAAVAGGICR